VALLETALPGLPKRRGKVRDVYDLGDDRLLIVATDRISAFDCVLPTGIPDKGRVLTGLSAFWFREELPDPNHLLSTEVEDAGLDLAAGVRDDLAGRVMIVRKAEVIPFECVVRGYLAGSAWKEYRATGTVCGDPCRPGWPSRAGSNARSSRRRPRRSPATTRTSPSPAWPRRSATGGWPRR
jgi:phosphoribosylaminoimidazole-succinocarboxamide synthase